MNAYGKLGIPGRRWLAGVLAIMMLMGLSAQASAALPSIPNTMSIDGTATCTGPASGQTIPVTLNIGRLSMPDMEGQAEPPVYGDAIVMLRGEAPYDQLNPTFDPATFVPGAVVAVPHSFTLNAAEAAELAANGTVTIPAVVVAMLYAQETSEIISITGSGSLVITGCQDIVVTETPVATPTETAPATPGVTTPTATAVPTQPTATKLPETGTGPEAGASLPMIASLTIGAIGLIAAAAYVGQRSRA